MGVRILQLRSRQFGVGREQFSKLYKGAHNFDIDRYRTLAI
jgi:hypothetical protein